jgi:Fe-S-cluster containining protein
MVLPTRKYNTLNKKLPLWIEEKGLQFKCTECGACCTGAPGYVWITKEDIQRLSKHLQIEEKELKEKYCRLVNGKYSLKEDLKTFDCIFLKNNKCSLYNARPKQCRTYPFWNEVIKNKKSWDEEVNFCPGINHKDGKFFSKEEILEKMDLLN